jgi:uncharacterized OB-fold protein
VIPLRHDHDLDFEPFWAGTAKGELRVQRCGSCGAVRWPPRDACAKCGAVKAEWVAVAGRGQLFSWTVIARTPLADFAERVPYVVGLVALDDWPVRFVGGVAIDDPDKLAIGMPVTVAFRDEPSGRVLPVWRPAGVQASERKEEAS